MPERRIERPLLGANGGPSTAWREVRGSLPPVHAGLEGWEIQRTRPGRVNARRSHDGRTFYLKWFDHSPRRAPARSEFENAAKLAALGIPTVRAAGWGEHGKGSFVVLEASPGMQADHWWNRCRDAALAAKLTEELARLAARLHDGGLCHRDLNVYHVLVDCGRLRLIDVGRVAPLGSLRRRRWIVKDLASLLYSARREGFPDDLGRLFLGSYLRATRRTWRRRTLLEAVTRKAERYRRHNRKKEERGLVP